MKKINIKDVQDGMVLAEPIKDSKGKIIIDKGVTLEGPTISEIFGLGLTDIVIQTEEDQHHGSKEVYKKFGVTNDNQLREKLSSQIKEKFGNTVSDPVMNEIMKIAIKIAYKKYNLDNF